MNLTKRLIAPLFEPFLAPLAAQRGIVLCLACVSAAQVGLHRAGIPGWICPFKAVTGLPCPGCGLTAAIDLLLRGKVQASLQTHAFAPIFLIGLALLLFLALLPDRIRQAALVSLAAFERRTGLAAWALLGLLFYWGVRLLCRT